MTAFQRPILGSRAFVRLGYLIDVTMAGTSGVFDTQVMSNAITRTMPARGIEPGDIVTSIQSLFLSATRWKTYPRIWYAI